MEKNDPSRLPPDTQRVLDWYFLLLEAEFARIESEFRWQFAHVGSAEVVALVEKFLLERFDAGAAWLAVALGTPRADGVALSERWLEDAIAKSLEYVTAVFQHWSDSAQQQAHFQISQRLRAKALAFTSEARFKLFDQQRSAVGETVKEVLSKSSSRRDIERRTVHRRRLIEKYRRDSHLTAPAFARRVGISETAIRGIVKEDRRRFSEGTRERLLQAIGATRELWDGPKL
jgi:DNA-binding transcriptional regulator YiaG